MLKAEKVQSQIASLMGLKRMMGMSCHPLSPLRAGVSSAMHITSVNFLSTWTIVLAMIVALNGSGGTGLPLWALL